MVSLRTQTHTHAVVYYGLPLFCFLAFKHVIFNVLYAHKDTQVHTAHIHLYLYYIFLCAFIILLGYFIVLAMQWNALCVPVCVQRNNVILVCTSTLKLSFHIWNEQERRKGRRIVLCFNIAIWLLIMFIVFIVGSLHRSFIFCCCCCFVASFE